MAPDFLVHEKETPAEPIFLKKYQLGEKYYDE